MRLLQILSFLILVMMPAISISAHAVDFDQDISYEDKEQFDEMLKPVMKIYNLIKYSASIIAGIVLLIAAVSFIPGRLAQANFPYFRFGFHSVYHKRFIQ
jgi:hypothetical protein